MKSPTVEQVISLVATHRLCLLVVNVSGDIVEVLPFDEDPGLEYLANQKRGAMHAYKWLFRRKIDAKQLKVYINDMVTGIRFFEEYEKLCNGNSETAGGQ